MFRIRNDQKKIKCKMSICLELEMIKKNNTFSKVINTTTITKPRKMTIKKFNDLNMPL